MRPLIRTLQYALLAAWSCFCLFPVYWLAIASIKPPADLDDRASYVPFADFSPSLEAWRFILLDAHENLLFPLLNSVVTAMAATLIASTLALLAIYGATRFQRSGVQSRMRDDSVLLGLLITRILSPIVLALPLYMMARATGTLDTLPALIFVYAAVNLPVAVWLLRPVLGAKASEAEEAALLDGASHVRILWEIAIPIHAAAIAAAGLIVFLLCWNEYLFAAFLTTNNATTLPVWAAGQLSLKEAQVGGGGEELAHLAAASTLMMLPVFVGAIILQRWLKEFYAGRAR